MLNKLSLFYNTSQRNVQLKHVHSEELSQLAKTLDTFRNIQEKHYRDDQHIQDVFAMLRGLFYKFCISLLPYDQVMDQGRQADIRKKLAQLKFWYPEFFASAVLPVAVALKNIFEKNKNDLTIELCRLINSQYDSDIAVVSKRGFTSDEQRALNDNLQQECKITYFSETSFRNSLDFYKDVFFIGTASYYGAWASECIKSDTSYFISYDIFTNRAEIQSIFPKQLSKSKVFSNIGENIKVSNPLIKTVNINNENLQITAKEAVQRVLANQTEKDSSNMQPVDASIVYLENEHFIFVSKNSKIRIFTPNRSGEFVKQISFQDLEEDMFIIIRNERDSKLIAEVADQEVLKKDAHRVRALQEEWKQRLKKLVNQKGLTHASSYLSKSHGMKTASTASIRMWCDEESICPRELPLLLKVLKYTEIEIKEIHQAMKRIKKAHITAGQRISKKLMSELTADISTELLARGRYTFTSTELNGASFNIERVASIDHLKHRVMPYNLMKLFELNA